MKKEVVSEFMSYPICSIRRVLDCARIANDDKLISAKTAIRQESSRLALMPYIRVLCFSGMSKTTCNEKDASKQETNHKAQKVQQRRAKGREPRCGTKDAPRRWLRK